VTEARDKRARILDAAVRIFADKGFYGAKVSEVARVAGVADGTIYLYFKSKDDLLISLFEDRMEQVNGNVRAAIAGEGGPVEKLRHLLVMHLEQVERDPRLAEVLTVELRQSAKFLREHRQSKFGEFLKLVATPIEQGQRDGSIRADLDAKLVARAIFGALDELALAWLLRPRAANGSAGKRRKGFEPARMAEQLADLFLDGLRARPIEKVDTSHRETKRRAT
jgi:TetR/AcrR family fatty acid metabolism transcriptional regulator